MKKLIIIIAIIKFSIVSFAQKSFNNPVLLFPLTEHTIIKVNGKEQKLLTEFFCKKSTSIEIIKGKVSLLTADGNEISLNSGEKIKVMGKQGQTGLATNSSPMDKLSRFMDKPSVYLPNLYSCDRNEFLIFPLKSKVYDKSNIKFYNNHEDINESEFKLYLMQSDSLIWQTNDPINEINGNKLPIKLGQKYLWRIYNGSNSLKGEFELLNEKQTCSIRSEALLEKMDYLNAIFAFLENDCIFDALAILSSACIEYPQSEMFKGMVRKLPIKLN